MFPNKDEFCVDETKILMMILIPICVLIVVIVCVSRFCCQNQDLKNGKSLVYREKIVGAATKVADSRV